jgi:tetratricopeptide (TPR) repeat protein
VSLKTTAGGNLQPPRITSDAIIGDFGPVFKQGLLYILLLAGFGFVTFKLGPIIGIVFILAALFFIPAMIILLVTTESLFFAINPAAFVRLVFRIGWGYLLMYLFLLLLVGAPTFLSQFFVPLLPERLVLVLLGFAQSFYTIISYHLMGYVILQYHDRIGYKVDYEDFQDPESTPAAAAIDPDQAILSEAEPLIQEGRLDEALEVIKRRSAVEGIKGLNLSERYYNLLKMRKRYRDMVEHANRHFELLLGKNERAKVLQVYAECTRVAPKFVPAADVLFKIGGWMNETGKTKESVGVLNRIINHYPGHPLAPKAYFRAAQIFNDRLMSADKAKKILNVLKQKYPRAEILPQVDNYLANL